MNDRQLEQEPQSLGIRLKNGNRAAAAELVDLYYKQIFLFMRRLGHSRQISEDLTQESFLQAWRHIQQLRETAALNGWLYRIAANVSRQHWRRYSIRKTVSIDGIHLQDCADEHDIAEHCEQLEFLGDAIAGLPLKLKQVVVLHYMQHLTIAEAAEAADLREGTFKSRLNRALKSLRKQIASK